MGIGDWGLGIGDWGLGPIPNPHKSDLNKNLILKDHYLILFNKLYLKIIYFIN